MKGLDDHEDGLNDLAFDRALSHSTRQRVPVLRDPAITFETKFATDLTTKLHRYRCATCATVGAWLEQLEAVRRNAQIHVTAHAQGDIR